jgi:hypothetical protein
MTTHITFSDIDYTAIVAETNSFLGSQPEGDVNELTVYPYPPLRTIAELIPSLFTTFVDKNLTIQNVAIVSRPVAVECEICLLDLYMLHIPLTSGIDENLTFFDVAEDADSITEWTDWGMLLSRYDRADCTEIALVELQPNVGILINKNSVAQWGNNTVPASYINITFNEDLSSYFA